MGTGYTRNDTTNNIADGNVINAADLDGEFDAIVTALSTTGHSHDGTAAEGGPVSVVGPAQDISITASIMSPKTDNTVDIGTSTLEFKDLFLDGTAHIDTLDVDENANIDGNLAVGGNLTVTGTTTFNGGTITMGDAATDNVVFGADINSSIIPNTDDTYDLGSSGQEWRDLYLDGTAHIDTLDVDVNATVAGTLGVTGIATFTDDIIIGDGKTIGSASDVDAMTIASNGQITLTQTLIGTALDISGDIDVDGTTNLDVVDIDGAVDMATTLQVDGVATFTGRDIHSGGITIANAGQIGSVGDTDAIAIASDGVVTLTQKLIGTELDISGNIDVDGTANLDIVDIDGAVNMATTALVTGVLTTTATQVATGGITSGSNIVSDTDSTDDLGTTSVRWANLFVDGITATDQITATGFTGTLDGILGSGAAAAATVTSLDTSAAVNLNLVTDSTSSTSGALIVDGGVGIAKKLYVGTDLDVTGDAVIDGTLAAGNATFSSSEPLITGVDTGLSSRIFTIGGNNGNCIIDVDPNGTAGGSLFQVDVDNGEVLKLTSAGAYVTGLLDVSTNAVIDGTALVTGVLTTTAATVFNGGFASNAASTIIAADGVADNAFVVNIKNQEATDSRSFGLKIEAGSTATDTPFFIKTHDDGTELFGVRGSGQVRFVDGTVSLPAISNIGDVDTGIFFPAADEIGFTEGGVEAARFDSGGRLLIGGTSSVVVGSTAASGLQLQSTGTNSWISQVRYQNGSSGPVLNFGKTRSTTVGTVGTIVSEDDYLGALIFAADDGTDLQSVGASITAQVDGTPGANDMPGRLTFSTTADGASSATERMRIDSSGNIIIANTGGTLYTTTAGTSNFRAGVNAGNSIASGGNYNVVVGDEAGTAITTGDYNVAVGYDALTVDTLGANSVAIGAFALRDQNFTSATNTYNVGVGYEAGGSITTGVNNTLIGGLSGDALTVGNANVAVGGATLSSDTKGDRNVAVGYAALETQNFTTSTDSYNTAVGYVAGNAVTTGVQNTLIGGSAGDALTTGGANTVVGYGALGGEDANSGSTAIGHSALAVQNVATPNAYNTALGHSAGVLVSTGYHNTLLGGYAGDNITSGDSNIIIGYGIDAASATADGQLNIGGWITGLAGAITIPGGLTANDGCTITTADNTTQLELISTDADNNIGPVLDLWRNSASPADGDDIGRIYFWGENDASQKVEYVMMRSSISDVTDGTEDSQFQIYTYVDGSQADRLHINPAETIFNESNKDVDFRVESDDNVNMLFVDGGDDRVGIGMVPDTTTLTVNGQVGTTNGTAGAPTHTFYGDPNTGMYRVGSDTIGFSTAGTERLAIDSTGIKFHGDTATANALNDYEEGTFTPVYEATGTAFGAIAYASQIGAYTKIGNVVTVNLILKTSSFTAGSTSGNVQISGLPFAADGGTGLGAIGAMAAQDSWLNFFPLSGWVNSADDIILVNNTGDRTSYRQIPVANMSTASNGNRLYITATYIAS